MQPRQFGVGWAWWTLAPFVGATIAMIAGVLFVDIPVWLLTVFALSATSSALYAFAVSRWRMVVDEDGLCAEPGLTARSRWTRWEELESIHLSRPAVQPKDGKPIPVPLSAEGLRDLDELAAEANGQPRGSLLTGGAPLHIQSVPTSLLVLGGVTVLLLAVGGLLWIAG